MSYTELQWILTHPWVKKYLQMRADVRKVTELERRRSSGPAYATTTKNETKMEGGAVWKEKLQQHGELYCGMCLHLSLSPVNSS